MLRLRVRIEPEPQAVGGRLKNIFEAHGLAQGLAGECLGEWSLKTPAVEALLPPHRESPVM